MSDPDDTVLGEGLDDTTSLLSSNQHRNVSPLNTSAATSLAESFVESSSSESSNEPSYPQQCTIMTRAPAGVFPTEPEVHAPDCGNSDGSNQCRGHKS